MRTTVLLVAVLAAIASLASRAAIIKDGSVASATFRGVWPSDAEPQPWHDDNASGAAKRRRRHDSPDFDQIIVETVEQPARHRHSWILILFLVFTGLFMGALTLLLCVLCLLKAFNGQIVYRPVTQRDDKFCIVENHGRPLVDVMFKQRSALDAAEMPIARKQRDVAQSTRDLPRSGRDGTKSVRDVTYNTRDVRHDVRDVTHYAGDVQHGARDVTYSTGGVKHQARDAPLRSARDVPMNDAPTKEYWEPQYSRDMRQQHQHMRESSNRTRGAYKWSAKVQHQGEPHSDDEDVDDHSRGKGLSNLRLDLRINEDSGRKDRNASRISGITQYPPEGYSHSSYSSSEKTNISHVSKSRPLLFSLCPDKKLAKDRGSKTSIGHARTYKVKDGGTVRPSDSRDSQASEVDENFFREQNATEVYQSLKTNNKAPGKPRSKNTEATPRKVSTTPHLGNNRTAPQHEDAVRQHVANGTDQLTLDQLKALIDEILNKKANKKSKDSS
ncbi:hypothetical protein HPB50_019637 [Hyalomma asiaticum]|uniref:Uncharacterized protein n=1 Tax=Hyalomma asiaticum TaxID=266040 RepID=A0ACB7T010_HYAAI|nr:hypothetical protein HPB50_019637 [Hyalomma asiaticum]